MNLSAVKEDSAITDEEAHEEEKPIDYLSSNGLVLNLLRHAGDVTATYEKIRKSLQTEWKKVVVEVLSGNSEIQEATPRMCSHEHTQRRGGLDNCTYQFTDLDALVKPTDAFAQINLQKTMRHRVSDMLVIRELL